MDSSISSSERKGAVRFLAAFSMTLLLGGMALVASTEVLVRSSVAQIDPYYQYLNLFRTATNPDAAFGDSHVMAGYVGQPGFVNLANGGENFTAISQKVHLYYEGKKPGRVIIQAGLHHFNLAFSKKKAADFRDVLTNLNQGILFMGRDVHRYELLTYWKIFLSGKSFKPTREFHPDGARTTNQRFIDLSASMRVLAAHQDAIMLKPPGDFRSSSVAAEYQSLISWLRAQGAQVCLVSFPTAPEFVEATAGIGEYDQARQYFHELAAQTGSVYEDFTRAALPVEYFADNHHLNTIGATQISPEIARRCFSR